MISDCDLLVFASDKYLAEAQITMGQLRALQVTALLPLHLALGDSSPVLDGVRVHNRRQPGTWSSEVGDALLQLEKAYVLMWPDDFVPLALASLERLETLVRWAIDQGVNYLRLNPEPPGDGARLPVGVREIPPASLYRTSLPFSLWRRTVLLDLLDAAESAWQFELVGAARSDRYDRFFASERAVVTFVNLVNKGLVDPRAERALVARGIRVDEVARPRMTTGQLTALRLKEIRSFGLRAVPWQWRRWARNRFSTNPGLTS